MYVQVHRMDNSIELITKVGVEAGIELAKGTDERK